MDIQQLVSVLEKTASGGQAALDEARVYLETMAQSNLPGLAEALSEILRGTQYNQYARQQAGLQLKNVLQSRDAGVTEQYRARWYNFSQETRSRIKQNCLTAFGTEGTPHSQAAQCVAAIACADLPMSMWPELMAILTSNVTNAGSSVELKHATLEALGYICQDINPELLSLQSNEILTAIIHGMKKDEPNDQVRLAATNALFNSLEFTKANFDREGERHFIMQVVCEATQSNSEGVREKALQCLVRIMQLYYQYMDLYMAQALFAITMQAMKSDAASISLQGIEFWSTVCDCETELAIEAQEAAEHGRPPAHTSRYYARGALPYLVPVLTELLTKQEEGDDDEWNPAKAASVCLSLLASCCEDSLVTHLMPFINQNIASSDWRLRDAAVLAFGSLLDGPDPKLLKPIIEQALSTLVQLLADTSTNVRDSAAWTIGRVCEAAPDLVIRDTTTLVTLLNALVGSLDSEPRVASNVCWALSSLADAAYDFALSNVAGNTDRPGDDMPELNTSPLSQFFDPLIQKLLAVTERGEGDSANKSLRSAAFEALMALLKSSPKDCYPTVQRTTLVVLEKLNHFLQLESQVQQADRERYLDMESLLCATLHSVLKKMTKQDALSISDNVMNALLRILNNAMVSQTNGGSGVCEDAFLAISHLIQVLSADFGKYLDALKPFLAAALRNTEDYQSCTAAIGVVGDLTRAVPVPLTQQLDEIMDARVHRDIKPVILSTFGDVALAIGPDFKKYLQAVLDTLIQAAAAQVDRSNPDLLDYLAQLRDGCLEAYSGILQGLRSGNAPNLATAQDLSPLHMQIPSIVLFMESVYLDPDHSDTNLCSLCALVGDLIEAFAEPILPLVERETISSLLATGRKSKNQKTRNLAQWATRKLRNLKTNSNSSSAPGSASTAQLAIGGAAFAAAAAALTTPPALNLSMSQQPTPAVQFQGQAAGQFAGQPQGQFATPGAPGVAPFVGQHPPA